MAHGPTPPIRRTTGAQAIGQVAAHSSQPDWHSARVMPLDAGHPEEIIGAAVSIGAATTSTDRSTSITVATTGITTSITDTVSGTTIRTSPTNSTRATTSVAARTTAWISAAIMVKPRFDRAAQEIARAEAACSVQVAAIVQVPVPATVRAAAIVQAPVPATVLAAAIVPVAAAKARRVQAEVKA